MIDLSTITNPFRNNVVRDAWQEPADVADIHDGVFQECLAGIESAARSVPDSLVVYGPAGSGKTHLLTRLQRRLAETAAAAPDRVLHCVFVYVRLQTSPLLLWQHVRRRFASDLMRRDQGVTQLQRLIAHQVSLAEGTSPRVRVMHFRVLSAEHHETLVAHLRDVAQNLALPRDLCQVLEHLICNRYVRDASAWLAGESLPEEVLQNLGLAASVDDDQESVAREMVTALCRLAGATLPIVFCFDQVEALQRDVSDHDAFFRFGRLAADLFDADENVFLITCVQSAVFETFRSSIREADRDRMMRRHAVLDELVHPQVERLIASRLEQVPELRADARSRFYPLSDEVVAEIALDRPCVPRKVLARATRVFEELQHGGNATNETDVDHLRNEFTRRQGAALRRIAPTDTTRILLQGLQPIAAVADAKVVAAKSDSAELELASGESVSLELCNEVDGRSLGPRLKKVVNRASGQNATRLLIVRDSRLPISKGALKTRGYLETLRQLGVAVVEPTIEALAAVAALSELLADAKSGDLANAGNSISEGKVLDWLRALRADLLIEPVQQFVGALTSEQVSRDSLEDDLCELLMLERVITAAAAGERLRVDEQRVIDIATARAERLLLLQGPPTVLLDIAGVPAELEVVQ